MAGPLACPVCGLGLTEDDAGAACARGHAFDRARAGYLNLAPTGRRRRHGDSAEMVRARAAFLAAGHFDELIARVARAVPAGATRVAEIGSGTGHYLAAATPDGADGIGFDLSKEACAHAARAHRGLRFAVADVEERVPLLDAAADVALSAFAPRPAGELARIVRPGGALVVAIGGERHLAALREAVGLIGVHPAKLERLDERLRGSFERAATELVEHPLALGREAVEQLVAMGPSARHGVGPVPRAIDDLLSVTVARYNRTGA